MCSYNILVDQFCDVKWPRENLYWYTDPSYLDVNYRLALLAKELQGYESAKSDWMLEYGYQGYEALVLYAVPARPRSEKRSPDLQHLAWQVMRLRCCACKRWTANSFTMI